MPRLRAGAVCVGLVVSWDAGSELEGDLGRGWEGALGPPPPLAWECVRGASPAGVPARSSPGARQGLLSFGETQIVWGTVSLRAQANAEWRMDGCRPGVPAGRPSGDHASDQQPRSPSWSWPRRPECSLSRQNFPPRFHGRKQRPFWTAECTLGREWPQVMGVPHAPGLLQPVGRRRHPHGCPAAQAAPA